MYQRGRGSPGARGLEKTVIRVCALSTNVRDNFMQEPFVDGGCFELRKATRYKLLKYELLKYELL
jgi:hypothetical protein